LLFLFWNGNWQWKKLGTQIRRRGRLEGLTQFCTKMSRNLGVTNYLTCVSPQIEFFFIKYIDTDFYDVFLYIISSETQNVYAYIWLNKLRTFMQQNNYQVRSLPSRSKSVKPITWIMNLIVFNNYYFFIIVDLK